MRTRIREVLESLVLGAALALAPQPVAAAPLAIDPVALGPTEPGPVRAWLWLWQVVTLPVLPAPELGPCAQAPARPGGCLAWPGPMLAGGAFLVEVSFGGGASPPSTPAGATMVPEPSTAALVGLGLGIAGLAAAGRRRGVQGDS